MERDGGWEAQMLETLGAHEMERAVFGGSGWGKRDVSGLESAIGFRGDWVAGQSGAERGSGASSAKSNIQKKKKEGKRAKKSGTHHSNEL